MKKPILSALLCIFVCVTAVRHVIAQGSAFPHWEAHLYTERHASNTINGEILRVSNNGAVSRFVVPEQFYPSGYAAGEVNLVELALSPDVRYLSGVFAPSGADAVLPIVIADLQSKSCCVTTGIDGTIAYTLGEFDPASGLLPFSYVSYNSDADPLFSGGIVVVDPQTGSIVYSLSDESFQAVVGNPYAPWAFLGSWVMHEGASYLQIHPNCYACEGVLEGEWSLWNPVNGDFITDSGAYFSIWGDVLPTTGEMLYLMQSPTLPGEPGEFMFPPPNAVAYFQDGVLPAYDHPTDVPLVYFDASLADLSGDVAWIRDGQAFVVAPNRRDFWTVIFRDSTQLSIENMQRASLLTGTPEGLLAVAHNRDTGESQLLMYTVELAGIFGSPLDSTTYQSAYGFSPGYRLLNAPAFSPSSEIALMPLTPITIVPAQAFSTSQPPPTVPPRQPSATPFSFTGPAFVTPTAPVFVCSGFVPRLSIGMQGAVTPGTPNNLRSEPLTSAPILAQIPGGGVFTVIGGPYCDPGGIGWLQINYNGIIGWTAEGQGGEYYVEPVAQG